MICCFWRCYKSRWQCSRNWWNKRRWFDCNAEHYFWKSWWCWPNVVFCLCWSSLEWIWFSQVGSFFNTIKPRYSGLYLSTKVFPLSRVFLLFCRFMYTKIINCHIEYKYRTLVNKGRSFNQKQIELLHHGAFAQILLFLIHAVAQKSVTHPFLVSFKECDY